MRVLPETATRKIEDKHWPRYVLAAVGLVALLLAATALLGGESFSPGERLYAPEFKGIAVSAENTAYPSSDVLRFVGRPEVVYVFLSVEDLPRGSHLEARVERSGRLSALSWLLSGGGDRLQVSDGQEEHLGPSAEGVAGVVKFAVRTESGEPLPRGNYTVSIYSAGNLAAKKYFAIGD
jgi:hypothetical protein